jgi:polyhydroxyalkanoate synthase
VGPDDGTNSGRAKSITLPRSDKRFADPRWRDNPFFALIHQAYLMIAEEVTAMADNVEGVEPEKKEQLRFATKRCSMR